MNLSTLTSIAKDVFFQDWEPRFEISGTGYLFSWGIPDGPSVRWRTRKHYVSSHACESEVIQTMLYAALQGVEHEARESFKVEGKRLYGPHINHIALAAVCEYTEERKTP